MILGKGIDQIKKAVELYFNNPDELIMSGDQIIQKIEDLINDDWILK